MKKHSKATILILVALSVTLATALTTLRGQNKRPQEAASNNSTVARQDNETFNERNSFTEEGPLGEWTVSAIFNASQVEDTSVPVAPVGVNSFIGKGKWRNLKLIGVMLDNRSTKVVQEIKLRWSITTREDEESVLAQGSMPYLEARIRPSEMREIETPVVNFAKELKSLIKEGILEGNYL